MTAARKPGPALDRRFAPRGGRGRNADNRKGASMKLTPDTENWPTPVVLSLITGRLLRDSFSDLHALAERVDGGSIWTHEFASKDTFDRLREAVLRQHPALAAFTVHDVCDKMTAQAAAERGCREFGATLTIAKPERPGRNKHPLDVLQEVAPDKPVLVVVTDS